jgi:hypothetical protein
LHAAIDDIDEVVPGVHQLRSNGNGNHSARYFWANNR